MPYANLINIALGSSKANLTLSASLYDKFGNVQIEQIQGTFSELGRGNYLFYWDSFPDNFRGAIGFFDENNTSILLAATSINPEDVEYVDEIYSNVNNLTSNVGSINTNLNNVNNTLDAIQNDIEQIQEDLIDLTNPPKEVTIEVPQILTKGTTVEILAGASTPSSSIQITTGTGT
jgi:hypothetical protein